MKSSIFCIFAVICACIAQASEIVVQRPASATQYVEATTADFGAWYDPAVWKLTPDASDLFNLEFHAVSGMATGYLSAAPSQTTLESIARYMLELLREKWSDCRLIAQERRIVSGKEVLFATYEGFVDRLHFYDFGYFYTGAEGTVEFVVGGPVENAEKDKAVAEAFLNGLQIGKPGETPAQANSSPATANSPEINVTELNATVPYGGGLSPDDNAPDIVGLQTQAAKGNADAQFLLSRYYDQGKWVARNPAKALELLEQASAKLPMAETELARNYFHGYLVPRDLKKAESLLRDAVSSGLPDAQTLLGQVLFLEGQKEGTEWIRKAADQRNAKAEYLLSVFYRDGTPGIPKDGGEEMKWMQRASSDGYPDAEFVMAMRYFDGNGVPKDTAQALKLLRGAANAGILRAEFDLGLYLFRGEVVAMDKTEAMQWFRRAADQGLANAQMILGTAYFTGDGLPKDIKQANSWYEKAADQGFPDAEVVLGANYLSGIGVEKDLAKAVEWMRKAAEQGNARAEGVLATWYWTKEANPPSLEDALRWAQNSADAGDHFGENALAVFYVQGKGVAVDQQKAFFWAEKAAAQGVANAETYVGMCTVLGKGTEMNIDEGVAWIQKAADQDEPVAEFLLGHYYEIGLGVPCDPAESAKWYRLSALQGTPKAEFAFAHSLSTGFGIKADVIEAYKWYMLAGKDKREDTSVRFEAAENMLKLMQTMTPEQIKEAEKRAGEFVPKSKQQPELLSFGLA
jgi:hypothetical protein